MRFGLLILCLAAALAGCRVGPNYHRPNVHPPPQFRDGEPNPTQASLGNVKWFDLFQDDVLRGLIKQALAANYDILIAAQRVIAAQGQFIATRSTLYPRLDGESSASRSNIAAPAQSQSDVLAILSWEADLFGRLRRATEAARADALAAEENQDLTLPAPRVSFWDAVTGTFVDEFSKLNFAPHLVSAVPCCALGATPTPTPTPTPCTGRCTPTPHALI